jgi:hypothetical protein
MRSRNAYNPRPPASQSYPQPVDDAWGRRCGHARRVWITTTLCGCSLSTGWGFLLRKTCGQLCGQLGVPVDLRPTVDNSGVCPQPRTHHIHRPEPPLTSLDNGYPQYPHHRRRRRFISLIQIKNHRSCGLWVCDLAVRSTPSTERHTDGPGSHRANSAGQNQDLPAGGIE